MYPKGAIDDNAKGTIEVNLKGSKGVTYDVVIKNHLHMAELDTKGEHMFDTVSDPRKLPPSDVYYDWYTGASSSSSIPSVLPWLDSPSIPILVNNYIYCRKPDIDDVVCLSTCA